MIELTPERYGQALVEQAEQFAETAGRAAPDAAVPTCPQWTLRGLVEHVGRTQHWVTSMVEERVSAPSQLPTSFAALPAEQRAWAPWLAEGAERLVAACVDAGTDAPVWNPSRGARTGTRFWLRRVLAEVIIHHAGAAATAELACELDAELAADVITEHLAMMTSPGWAAQRPGVARELSGSGRTMHWHATDGPGLGAAGEWFIEHRPGEQRGNMSTATPTSRPAARLSRCCSC